MEVPDDIDNRRVIECLEIAMDYGLETIALDLNSPEIDSPKHLKTARDLDSMDIAKHNPAARETPPHQTRFYAARVDVFVLRRVARVFMEPETVENEQKRRFAAVDALRPHGFRPVGGWRFAKGGKTYDLSAADIGQIERIEANGLFIVNE